MPQTLLLKTALNMKVMFGRVFNKYTSKVKTDEDKSSFPKRKRTRKQGFNLAPNVK